jgi:hypothetical protein
LGIVVFHIIEFVEICVLFLILGCVHFSSSGTCFIYSSVEFVLMFFLLYLQSRG